MAAFLDVLTLCLLNIFNISNSKPSQPPNILLIMMDDLGFSDTSINGGTYPMSTLDELSTNGIKLNYHYSNTLCSASRSSLLTGRYAWRTGVVKIVKPLTLQHTNENIPFISEILSESNNNYNTAMFGKFHLGYSSQNYLPFNRGFDKTLFFESGAIEYTSHKECNQWFWALKGILLSPELRTLLMSKFYSGFCSYDLWDENYNIVENNIYSEKLYTHNIIKYINDIKHDKKHPFFIYYSMQTPHWPLEYPPKLYDQCIGNERKIFCNALLYGDEMVGKIVDNLKQNNLYDNTVIIFLSDNGPNTNWGTQGFGQTLPLRGAKGSTFEGGIRTPALISGGFVENNCPNVGTSYKDMVHISDWYAMIKYIADINGNKDIAIDGINLWPDICGAFGSNFNSKSGSDIDEIKKREAIMHFSMIDVNDKDKGYGPSYIRTDKWKLVVNASLRMDGNVAYKYWVNYDNEFTIHPPQKIYRNMMLDEMNHELYESTCYNEYIDDIDKFDDFSYKDIMLFRINEDHIEACNIAKFYPHIVDQLMDTLFSDDNIEQYIKYQIYKAIPSKQGALAQIESYNCNTKKSYHLSWNELENYNDETLVKDVSWNDIFYKYVDIVDGCNMHSKQNNDDQNMESVIIISMLTSVMIAFIVVIKHILNGKSMLDEHNKKVMDAYDVSDITPLLSISEQ